MENPLLEKFRTEHAHLEARLREAERALFSMGLRAMLLAMRADVMTHFKEKDAFYPALAKQAALADDTEAVQLTKIFEANMKVQSSAVQRFFETLETQEPPELSSTFKTVATVIRHRFETEERSVFPLYERTVRAT